MKKNNIVESLREILIAKINTLDLDNLRATYFALLPVTADPELKVLLFGEPEPDDEIKEQLPAPSAIQQDVQSKSVSKAVKEDLPAGTFAAEDELPAGEFTGGDEIEPEENTLLEKIQVATPVKKPELPQGTASGECWVITRSYGFIPDGPGYDITGDELIYGIYDSWEPAIEEFKNISERTGKPIEEGTNSYTITDWNPKTGTAGYTLKKHGVNGNHSDEDEFCEMFYSMAAEFTVNIMETITKGNGSRADRIDSAADMISVYMQEQVIPCIQDACKVFGCWDMSELPATVKNAVDMAFAASESSGKMLLNMITS